MSKEEDLKRKTVPELRKIAKKLRLDTSFYRLKKADLIELILRATSTTEVEQISMPSAEREKQNVPIQEILGEDFEEKEITMEKRSEKRREQQKVAVVQLLTTTDKPFTFSGKYCVLNKPISDDDYVIELFVIPADAEETDIDTIVLNISDAHCVMLYSKRFQYLTQIYEKLSSFKNSQRFTYVFFNTINQGGSIKYNHERLRKNFEPKNTKLIYLLGSYTLPGIMMYITEDTEEKVDAQILKYIETDDRELACQSWFNYFLMTQTPCSDRFIQLSGTCYMNSVINGLFLSKGCRLLLKEIFNKFPKKFLRKLTDFPSKKEFLSKEISEKIYFLKLIYHFLCKQEKLKYYYDKPNPNLFLQASCTFFSASRDPMDHRFGEGGITEKFVFSMLNALEIQYCGIIPGVVDQKTYYRPFIFSKSENKYIQIEMEEGEKRDMLVLFKGSYPKQIFTYVSYKKVLYKLQFVDIRISLPIMSHSVVGVFCNGKPAIVDSSDISSPSLFYCNWLNSVDGEIKDETTLQKLRKIYKDERSEFTISCAFYICNEKYDQLKSNPPACIVDEDISETVDF
jgi:hypothetical protein